MRRLAVQSRDDGYSSNRDYQTILEKNTHQITTNLAENIITLTKIANASNSTSSFIGFGGFLYPSSAVSMEITISVGDISQTKTYELKKHWCRVGLSIDAESSEETLVTVTLKWNSDSTINFWGLNSGYMALPEVILDEKPSVKTLNATHLSPETYYLEHDAAIDMDFDDDNSTRFSVDPGVIINLKKCSYCQRELPINPQALGALSFHKHRAKLTKHQNECRSCKKWRINNSFNPLRTTDQLHESSVITRERKILLKEPAILQEIKDRTGAGLKSQIWERFDRKCFFCNEDVELNDFQLDHTRPLAYLWPIDEHATCLCAEHNNQKKDKFPVEFYNEDQLIRLSQITGLSHEELSQKDVNQAELDRILSDIVSFAREWDSRTFVAISRKISELRPETDLLEILKETDESAHASLTADLEDRPEPVA